MCLSYIRAFLGCAALVGSPVVLSQSAVVDVGNGVSIQGSSSGTATVRVNGTIVNAVSGANAVAETHIGSRSNNAHTEKTGSASIVEVDENGTQITISTGTATALPDASGKTYVNTDLSGRNFFRANLSGYSFVNVKLTGANLREADLRNAEFVNVDLTKADLTGADLTGATFVNSDIGDAVQEK